VWAPAKLNLFLRILGPRPDGYHELVTLIAAINLFDTLTLVPRESSDIELDCKWNASFSRAPQGSAASPTTHDALPRAEDNLVYKALRLLQSHSGCQRGASVELIKRIPPASGLGGGSSDAAAALVAGNHAWQLGYSRDQLAGLAAQLGSDVPFFLQPWSAGGGTLAVCRGRGELVTRAQAPAGLHFVVARPATGLSTPEVYRRYKVSHSNQQSNASVDELLTALRTGNSKAAAAHFTNDLAQPAIELSPAVSSLASDFAQLHPLAHQMSGSGSAYYGWFRHARHARRAAASLSQRGYPHVWHVQTI
jgi:4-diphosphocytidyl-2-C-methyl-D-erythritol kinase